MKCDSRIATLFSELVNLVNECRIAQIAFQERPAAPLFLRMREKEKALDVYLAEYLPPPPVTPDMQGAFP